MKYSLSIFSVFAAYKFAKCNLEPYITGGDFVEYDQYPHSILLVNVCRVRFICGGSVLTQELVLTAAHCLSYCVGIENPDIQVKYGHEKIRKMKFTHLKKFVLHENYNDFTLMSDIGLIYTNKKIPLNDVVKRVIIMKNPPITQLAHVAGWGVDEFKKRQSILKHTDVTIQELQVCQNMRLFDGIFCGGPITGLGAAAQGDSGSALIINNYIQIGLVSFKVPEYSLVAYTNVSYYLDWIEHNAMNLFCSSQNQ